MSMFRKKKKKEEQQRLLAKVAKTREIAIQRADNERRLEEVTCKVVDLALQSKERSYKSVCSDRLAVMYAQLMDELTSRQLKLERLALNGQQEDIRDHRIFLLSSQHESLNREMKHLKKELRKCSPRKARLISSRLNRLRDLNHAKDEILTDLLNVNSDDDDDDDDAADDGKARRCIEHMQMEAMEGQLLEAPPPVFDIANMGSEKDKIKD